MPDTFRLVLSLLLLASVIAVADEPSSVDPSAPDRPALEHFTADVDSLDARLRALADRASASRMRLDLLQLTSEPHEAGTPRNREIAEHLAATYREHGLQAAVEGFHILLSYPERIELHMVDAEGSQPFDLREKGHPLDKDALDPANGLPFNAYAGSGDVTAPVVYVNYAREEDFRHLERLGVDVRGKVLLARYGKIFRGFKARWAEHFGAAALVLYSDPEEDGPTQGPVYPDGPWRPSWAVQRGSVIFPPAVEGDPATPGFASPEAKTASAFESDPMPFPPTPTPEGARPLTRAEVEERGFVPSIPVLPISAANAERILRRLGGDPVPADWLGFDWAGGLELTYRTGPGPVSLRVVVEMDDRSADIYNAIGWIPGTGDEVLLLGNHHDAWLYGAVDATSGTVAVLEAARILGEAARAGWRPRRTIVFAAWDAEEYCLGGSTEFAERYRDALLDRLAAYVNVDAGVGGGGTPGAVSAPHLQAWAEMSAERVSYPLEPGTFRDAWLAALAPPGAERAPRPFLASGSDHAIFQAVLGVSSTWLGVGEAYGVYHSNIDNFFWMDRIGDPEFLHHRGLARWLAVTLALGADVERLPFVVEDYAVDLRGRLDAWATQIRGDGPLARSHARAVEAADRWLDAARAFDARGREAVAAGDAEAVARWNAVAREVDRRFVDGEPIPGVGWHRHPLYAPDPRTGYGRALLPRLDGALERLATESGEEVVARELLDRLAAALDRQTAALTGD